MQPKKLKIFKIFDEASQYLTRQEAKIDQSRINEIFSSIYSPGISFQYIFDFSSRKFVYISDSVFDLFGEHPDTFTVDSFMERLHPEDVNHFAKCEKIAGHFLFSHIKKELIPEYKVSYQMRMKDRTGNYKLILHQAIAMSMDDDLNLAATLANHSDISHITTVNNYKVSFIHIKGGQSYYNIGEIEDLQLQSTQSSLLSNREIEILGLLSEGLSTKEIAEQLFLSPDTVRTHRNNILKKSNFNTLTQAVGYYIREGLI